VTALAASPWAPLIAIAGHERVYLYDLAKHAGAGELAFPEGVPYVLRFSRNGEVLVAAADARCRRVRVVLFRGAVGKKRSRRLVRRRIWCSRQM